MTKTDGRFAWTIHNMIAHPLMEILHQFGMTSLGNRIHDWTLPTTMNIAPVPDVGGEGDGSA